MKGDKRKMQFTIVFSNPLDYLSVLDVIGDCWEGLESFPDTLADCVIQTALESSDLGITVIPSSVWMIMKCGEA
jgi:hypothetical protein